MAKITINGKQLKVKNGTTILKAAESIGVRIPSLCFLEEINEIGFCRICIVDVEGEQDLVSACNTEVTNGMVIETESQKVLESRKTTLALLASRHRFDCWKCPKDGICEFYDLLKEHDVVFEEFGPGKGRNKEQIFGTGISQDQTKCVLCKRCVAVCSDVVTTKVLKFRDESGINPTVSPTIGLDFDDAGCIFCGQCTKACPTGTLFETPHAPKVKEWIKKKDQKVIAQVSPAVAATIAEEFGYPMGTKASEVEGKVYEALNLLGFDEITDLSLGKDLTIVEQTKELLERVESGEKTPLFTTSCPAWVRYAEMYQPTYLDKLSRSKSVHTTQGALIKGYFADKYLEANQNNLKVVSILPCTSAKKEITRDDLINDGINDVDAVLTVRELAKMIKNAGINFRKLDGVTLENPLAEAMNANVKKAMPNAFEMILKNVYKELEQADLTEIAYKPIKGLNLGAHEGTAKEALITLKNNNKKLLVAVVHGGAAISKVFKLITSGKKQYDFVEFMACPGGCLNGGGTPLTNRPFNEVIDLRKQSMKNEALETVNPSENEALTKVYTEFLNEQPANFYQQNYSQKAFTKE